MQERAQRACTPVNTLSPVVSHALLQEFSAFLASRLGLHFPPERWPDLACHLLAIARETKHAQPDACLRALMAQPPTQDQVELLARHLSVGETYFFRDPAMFAVLEHEVLPQLIAARRRAGERRLRLWSAACCTGEEAYSLAIVVSRLIPDLADWQILILATDINAAFLAKAARGAYTAWSFRGMPDGYLERYFEARPDASQMIAPALRRMVSFAHLNLASQAYPAPAGNTDAMDLILCRNVLMYFTPERARHVIGQLHRALLGDGWLVLNPSEVGAALLPGFTAANFAHAVLHRKAGAAPGPAMARPPIPIPIAHHGRDAGPADAPAHAPAHALLARTHANMGQLGLARQHCDAALRGNQCDPALHYLMALILQEQGHERDAVAALKRVLFLNQKFVLAHFALGHLCRNDSGAAARHRGRALTLLADYPPQAILPESGGMSAARLIELIHAGIA